MVKCFYEKWQERLESEEPITKAEWQTAIKELRCNNPKHIVNIVNDEEGFFAHDLHDDATVDFGQCGLYRAGIQTSLLYPNADIRIR